MQVCCYFLFYNGDGICGFFSHLFQRCLTSPFSTAREPGGWLPSVTGSWSFHRPTPLGFPLCSHCCCSLKHLASLLPSLTTSIQHTWPQQPEWLCYCSAYNPSRLFCVWHKSHHPHPGPQGSPWGDFSLLSTLSLWSPSSPGAQCSRGALLAVPQFSPSRTFGKPSPCQPLGTRSPPDSAQYPFSLEPLWPPLASFLVPTVGLTYSNLLHWLLFYSLGLWAPWESMGSRPSLLCVPNGWHAVWHAVNIQYN